MLSLDDWQGIRYQSSSQDLDVEIDILCLIEDCEVHVRSHEYGRKFAIAVLQPAKRRS